MKAVLLVIQANFIPHLPTGTSWEGGGEPEDPSLLCLTAWGPFNLYVTMA